jgi:tellurite resistance protein TehA-like permease
MHGRALTWTDKQIEGLYPGSFAFVMATGIISIALQAENFRALSDLLFAVAVLGFVWLAGLTILRAVRFPHAMRSDLLDPRLVFSFFTVVAGTDVLGGGTDLRGFTTTALYLWLFALLLWLILFYFSFAVLMFINAGTGSEVLRGAWLLAIVGTQSLAVLCAAVAPRADAFGAAVIVLIHMLWGIGLALYAIYVTLFIYRVSFFSTDPDDLSPVLWVVMGAAAISTNAGTAISAAASALPHLALPYIAAMRPFVDSVTLVVWAWATLWIPLLILMGIWKHGIRRIPIAYSPLLWSIVFPLGMYAFATLRFAAASEFTALRAVADVALWIAVAAWIVTFAAFARATWQSLRTFRRSVPASG